MPIYMGSIQSSLPDDSSYQTFANMQVGSNGDIYGDPTTSIGDSYGEEAWDYNTWDSDVSTGFDTGNMGVQFDVKSDGTETLNVGTDTPLTYQTDPIGAISSISLEAALQLNGEVKWSNVTVEFLHSGSIVETDDVSGSMDLNEIGQSTSSIEDQIVTVTPTVTDADEAIVFGTMRMRAPGISYPASTSMYVNVFVN